MEADHRIGEGQKGARRTRPIWRSLILLALAATGCIPAVAHSPRVEEGFSGGYSAGLGWGHKYEETSAATPYVMGPLGIDLGYGWRNEGWLPPVRLGLEFVPLPPRFDPDLYVQVPPRALPEWLSAGVGFASTAPIVHAQLGYFQLGVVNPTGISVYTTQGYLRQPPVGRIGLNTIMHDNGWVSILTVQRSEGPVTARIFVMNVMGRQFPSDCGAYGTDCRTLPRPWMMLFGYAVERRSVTR